MMSPDLLRKLSAPEVAMLLAIELDHFWSLGRYGVCDITDMDDGRDAVSAEERLAAACGSSRPLRLG